MSPSKKKLIENEVAILPGVCNFKRYVKSPGTPREILGNLTDEQINQSTQTPPSLTFE